MQGDPKPVRSSKKRGGRLACEAGTNVAVGTQYFQLVSRLQPWYFPHKSKSPANWRDKWMVLRSRFDGLIDKFSAVECVLIQRRVPAFCEAKSDGLEQKLFANSIYSGGGLELEAGELFSATGGELVGEFPIMSVRGTAILNSQGKPRAFGFGLFRQYFVQPTSAWAGTEGSLPVPQLGELARDGTHLLYELPAELAVKLWRNWLDGFSKARNVGESLWFHALFEMSWQNEPGNPLYSTRFAWERNCSPGQEGDEKTCSIGLEGDGLFPTLPKFVKPKADGAFCHENGHPVAWYAKLDDVARASVAAIDILLEADSTPSVAKAAGQLREAGGIAGNAQGHSVSSAPKRDQVFISHSSKDEKYLNELLVHLKPLEQADRVSVWSDKKLKPGSEWFNDIEKALRSTKVAVLLVSKDFLASEFIREHELRPVLDAARDRELTIHWVLVSHCNWEASPLKALHAVHPTAKALADMRKEKRDAAWVSICKELQAAADA